jgi:hypothetical protein
MLKRPMILRTVKNERPLMQLRRSTADSIVRRDDPRDPQTYRQLLGSSGSKLTSPRLLGKNGRWRGKGQY